MFDVASVGGSAQLASQQKRGRCHSKLALKAQHGDLLQKGALGRCQRLGDKACISQQACVTHSAQKLQGLAANVGLCGGGGEDDQRGLNEGGDVR